MSLTLDILIGLLPGFFALKIGETITRLSRPTPFDRGLDAFLLNLAIAIGCLPFFDLFDITWPSLKNSNDLIEVLTKLGLGLVLLLVSSGVWGWLYSRYLNWDKGKQLTWHEVINELAPNHWILIHLPDKTQIIGWLAKWGMGKEGQLVVLVKDATEYGPNGQTRTIPDPGVLLTLDESTCRIEFQEEIADNEGTT